MTELDKIKIEAFDRIRLITDGKLQLPVEVTSNSPHPDIAMYGLVRTELELAKRKYADWLLKQQEELHR